MDEEIFKGDIGKTPELNKEQYTLRLTQNPELRNNPKSIEIKYPDRLARFSRDKDEYEGQDEYFGIISDVPEKLPELISKLHLLDDDSLARARDLGYDPVEVKRAIEENGFEVCMLADCEGVNLREYKEDAREIPIKERIQDEFLIKNLPEIIEKIKTTGREKLNLQAGGAITDEVWNEIVELIDKGDLLTITSVLRLREMQLEDEVKDYSSKIRDLKTSSANPDQIDEVEDMLNEIQPDYQRLRILGSIMRRRLGLDPEKLTYEPINETIAPHFTSLVGRQNPSVG